jgi:hypothetical protein
MLIGINGLGGRRSRRSMWKAKVSKSLENNKIKTINPMMLETDRKKEDCDFLVYILTSSTTASVVAELVHDIMKYKSKVVICIVKETFKSKNKLQSMSKIEDLAQKYSVTRSQIFYDVQPLISFLEGNNTRLHKEAPDMEGMETTDSKIENDETKQIKIYFDSSEANGKKEKSIKETIAKRNVDVVGVNKVEDADLTVSIVDVKKGRVDSNDLAEAHKASEEADDMIVYLPSYDEESKSFDKIKAMFKENETPITTNMEFLCDYIELIAIELFEMNGGGEEEVEDDDIDLEEENDEPVEVEEEEEETEDSEEDEEFVKDEGMVKESPDDKDIFKISNSEIYSHLDGILRLDKRIKKFLDTADVVKPSNAEFDFLRLQKKSYKFKNQIEKLIADDRIVLLRNADTSLSKSIMFMPLFKNKRDYKLYVNVTSLTKEKKEVEDDKEVLKFRFNHDNGLENVLTAAYTMLEVASNPNMVKHNFKIRKQLFEVYSTMMMSTINRMGSVANKTDNAKVLKYILAKYMHLSVLGLGYSDKLEDTCQTLSETKNLDKIELINMEHDTKDFISIKKVLKVIKKTFPQLKIDLASFIKVHTMLFGELGIFCIDYVPYLVVMAFSERYDFAIYSNKKTIKKELKLPCNRLQTVLLSNIK